MRRRVGIYLLPSLITTASLCSGFFAVINILSGSLRMAAWFILLSVLLDALDGRIARWTHTESRFGAEYDSLSDAVVFGCVPALLALQWLIGEQGAVIAREISYAAVFCYMTTAVLRLARFNVSIKRKYFLGMPCPAAAALQASLIMVLEGGGQSILGGAIVIVALFVSGILMVSNLGYYSFRTVDIRQRVRLIALALSITVLIVVIRDFVLVILLTSLVYTFSAPALYLWRWFKKRRPSLSLREGDGS